MWFSSGSKDDTTALAKRMEEECLLRKKADDDIQATMNRIDVLETTVSELKSNLSRVSNSHETLKTHVDKNQVIFYNDGTMYSGQLLDGVPHGFGTIFHVNGVRYVGEWKAGKYHGQGTLYRDAYSTPFYGTFQDHIVHGPGSYDGVVYDQYIQGVCQAR